MTDAPLTMNQVEYAAHRGVSAPYVHKLYHQGRLKLDDAGQILVVESDESLGDIAEDPTPKPQADTFATWQSRKAEADAKLAELKYQREVAGVVDKAEVDRTVQDIFGDLRERLITQLPPRVAPMLAAKSDEREVLWALRTAIEEELTGFAERLTDMTDAADESVDDSRPPDDPPGGSGSSEAATPP